MSGEPSAKCYKAHKKVLLQMKDTRRDVLTEMCSRLYDKPDFQFDLIDTWPKQHLLHISHNFTLNFILKKNVTRKCELHAANLT